MTTHPLRVLHAHSGNVYGGVETLLVSLVRYQAYAPELTWRFALTAAGRLSDELTALGAAPAIVGVVRASRPWTVWAARAQLRRLLLRSPCDVMVVHSEWSLAVFGPVAHAAAVPLLLWLHGAAAGPGWLRAWSRRAVPAAIIANSRFTAASWAGRYPATPTDVVYYPFTPIAATGTREDTRAALATPPETPVLLQLARLEAGKGHRVLLEALASLRDRAWHCWIVGAPDSPEDTAYRDALVADAHRFGVTARVKFLGERRDTAALLAAADIYCQPNVVPEGFGLSLLEALYTPLPVVASATGATLELVDATTALLVAPGDAAGLSAALASLLADPARRRDLAIAGRRWAAAIVDTAQPMRRLVDVLRAAHNERADEGG